MPTDTELDDARIGVPVQGRATWKPEASPPSPTQPDEPVLRAGETDLGKPPQLASFVAPLTDDDRRRLRDADEVQALRDLAEAEELLASDPSLKWFGWFAHPLAAAFLLGSAGMLGLFLYSQMLSILANLATQPEWVQYTGYSGLALCGAAVLYAMLRLVILYVKLRRNRQLRVAGLEELNQRTRLRWLAHAKAASARGLLERYLREFPMGTEKERKKLHAVGLNDTTFDELAKVKAELLDPAKFTSTAEWFERFRTGFQAKLDEAADGRVKYWAKRTGMVTALAPNGLVDSAASMYFGFAMLTDLCRVYNLRAGRTGTAVLLGRVFFNSYLAGQMNEWEKLTEEQLNQLLAPHGPLYELTAAKVFSKAGAKVTSGILNYYLLKRLGGYGCRLLRPVA
jgi:uncharacterized membrane protein YcjF (UPF0283 family)